MQNKQALRDKVADFLQEIRLGVAKIQAEQPTSFNFSAYVTDWDSTHGCGTICCMEGWVPRIRPDIARWSVPEWAKPTHDEPMEIFTPSICVIGSRSNLGFRPALEGIPMTMRLWQTLTLPGYQNIINELELAENASFPTVHDLWARTENRVRAGELDEFLIFPTPNI